MSLDDSDAPETGQTSSAPGRRSGLLGNVPLLAGLVLVLAVGLFAVFTLVGGDEAPASTDCVSATVALTTAPVMEDLVMQAVKDVNEDEPCIDIQVTAGTVKDVVASLADPDAELPEIWIPDSPTWKGQLTAAASPWPTRAPRVPPRWPCWRRTPR